MQRVGKAMLNLFSPQVRATCGVDSMKTLGGIKVPVSFTSLMLIKPRRKVRSAWMAVLSRLSRILMCLYMVMLSRSTLKQS